MFYWAVLQAVLLFGAETWILLEAMSRKLEGVHVVFLSQITGQKENRQRDRIWKIEAAAKVLKGMGTQSLRAYIDKCQETVAEWVALRTTLEVCDKEKGYEGGGRLWERWWRQTAAQKQLSATLK